MAYELYTQSSLEKCPNKKYSSTCYTIPYGGAAKLNYNERPLNVINPTVFHSVLNTTFSQYPTWKVHH